jgi:hypothetical protein
MLQPKRLKQTKDELLKEKKTNNKRLKKKKYCFCKLKIHLDL